MLRFERVPCIAAASVAAISLAACKESAGPAFANASGQDIRVHADFDAEPYNAVDSLTLQPGQVFRDPFKHQVLRITVETQGQRFRLEAAEVASNTGPIDPWTHVWLFDGTMICLMPLNKIDPARMTTCDASR
jgi:hypothetical protein